MVRPHSSRTPRDFGLLPARGGGSAAGIGCLRLSPGPRCAATERPAGRPSQRNRGRAPEGPSPPLAHTPYGSNSLAWPDHSVCGALPTPPSRGTVNMTTVLVRQSIGPKEEHLRWLALCTE